MENIIPNVFLICSERSGSNLITKMIDAHPDFCGPSPSHLLRIFSKNLFRYGNLDDEKNWMMLVQDIVAVNEARLGKWKTTVDENDILQDVKERSLVAAIDYIYRREARACGKRYIFFKENRLHTFLPFVLAGYPDAKFLHLVRDPRDMALSWKLSKNHPGGVVRAAEIWMEDQKNAFEITGFLGPEKRIIALRYEDLLRFPESSARWICRFLDVDYHPDMLRFYENDLTVENAKRLEDWSNLKRPVMNGNFNKYKSRLSEAEIRFVERICHEGMMISNYSFEYPFDPAGWDKVQAQVSELEERLLAEKAVHTPEEDRIRKKRLDVIQRIIHRQQFDFSGFVCDDGSYR